MSYTLLLLLVTVLVSIAAFNNEELKDRLIFWPGRMDNPAEYYRFLTSGFIHADITHLLFNMFTLYFIGQSVENIFMVEGKAGAYLVLYLSAIVVSSIPTFLKYRNNGYYRSLGASGGVAAVMFALVCFNPWATLIIYFIKMPSIVFALIYLGYTMYMARRGGGHDNINHDAHLWGSLYGFVFTLVVDPGHLHGFLERLVNHF